jgi:copper chaperone CopZ
LRKTLTLLTILIAVLAMTSGSVFAGEGCSASKDKQTKVSAVSGKACTPEELAACHTKCSPEELEACAKTLGITAEECHKMMVDGKMVKQVMSVEGMTCGGCEGTVTTALKKLDGVYHVISVSHVDKNAVVCVDPSKVKTESLIKAVSDTGYKAEIIAAVAKTDAPAAGDKKACSKTCSSKEKAACGSKDKDKKGDDTI